MLGFVHAACGIRPWAPETECPSDWDPIRDLRSSGGESVLFASGRTEEMMRRNGLADVDGVFARGRSATRRHRRRTVCDARVVELDGAISRIFLKLDWGRRIWPRTTDIKTGQVLQSLPEREWHGLHRLRDLGLSVPETLALYRPGLFSSRAAIAVREVPVPDSVDALLQSGEWWDLGGRDRRELVDVIVETVGRIHEAGLAWRGTSSRHFFPEWDDRRGWDVWVIDCEGIHRRLSSKCIERDYRKLRRSFRESGADAETLQRLEKRIAGASAPRRRIGCGRRSECHAPAEAIISG